MTRRTAPYLAIALTEAGWHPAAWRRATATPETLLRARYWRDAVRDAEHTGAQLVTIDDGFSARRRAPGDPDDPGLVGKARTDVVTGRLDSTLIAARIAPTTAHIGIAPTVVTTHTEPFHASKAVATLDYVARGRAGVVLDVDPLASSARLIGRKPVTELDAAPLYAEAADYAEVLARLWDSWQDDAEIRDVTTGRFIDRDRLHHIDFEGRFFSVRGPSITPRPPQGQPVIAGFADLGDPVRSSTAALDFLGSSVDVAFVAATDPGAITSVGFASPGRRAEPLRVVVDLLVFIDDDADAAARRRGELDTLADAEYDGGSAVFTGNAAELADRVAELTAAGTGIDGIRLRPATIPDDLARLAAELPAALTARGLARPHGATLRAGLDLPNPANRYAREDDQLIQSGV